MGLGSWESIQGPIVGHQAQLLISFGVISLLPMEYYDPSTFLGNWALVVMYFCYGFCIFNRPILEEYVSYVERGTRPSIMPSCSP
jgi:hypothetical protein